MANLAQGRVEKIRTYTATPFCHGRDLSPGEAWHSKAVFVEGSQGSDIVVPLGGSLRDVVIDDSILLPSIVELPRMLHCKAESKKKDGRRGRKSTKTDARVSTTGLPLSQIRPSSLSALYLMCVTQMRSEVCKCCHVNSVYE
jgi:hypothetical protein